MTEHVFIGGKRYAVGAAGNFYEEDVMDHLHTYIDLEKKYQVQTAKTVKGAVEAVAEPEILNEMRASNNFKERFTDHLADMVASGRLDKDEFTYRRDKALHAKYEKDLYALLRDLPSLPEVPQVKKLEDMEYKSIIASDLPFHLKTWITLTSLAVSLIVLPGPLMAAAFHGFKNAPGGGTLPILLILLGAVSTVVFGVALGPGENRKIGKLNPKYREKYRKYAK